MDLRSKKTSKKPKIGHISKCCFWKVSVMPLLNVLPFIQRLINFQFFCKNKQASLPAKPSSRSAPPAPFARSRSTPARSWTPPTYTLINLIICFLKVTLIFQVKNIFLLKSKNIFLESRNPAFQLEFIFDPTFKSNLKLISFF